MFGTLWKAMRKFRQAAKQLYPSSSEIGKNSYMRRAAAVFDFGPKAPMLRDVLIAFDTTVSREQQGVGIIWSTLHKRT